MEKENVKENEPKVTPDQKVLIVGCTNSKVKKSVQALAKRNDVDLVWLDDKIVFDYLEVKGVKVEVQKETLDKFLSSVSNRVTAEKQAEKLWAILTGTTNLEQAEEQIFTEQMVCKKTTLSHSKANQVFNLLRAFGLFEWVNIKKREFKLHFDKSYCASAIENDVVAVGRTINLDILRYKKALEGDERLDEATRKEKIEGLKNTLFALFDFD